MKLLFIFIVTLTVCGRAYPQCGGISFFFFDGVTKNAAGKVVLNWRTNSESFTPDRFEIERSTDAVVYTKIGVLSTTQNTFNDVAYQFIDACPGSGRLYYRIRWVTIDNNSCFSPIVTINLPPYTCSSQCSLTSMNGPALICSGGTGRYSIQNSPANVTWSVSNPSIVSLAQRGPTDVILTATGTGTVTLTGTVSGCAGTLTKVISVGTPTLTNNGISYYSASSSVYYTSNSPLGTGNGFPVSSGGTGYVNIFVNNPNITNITWGIQTNGNPPVSGLGVTNGGQNCSFSISLNPGAYGNSVTLSFSGQTACGAINTTTSFSIYKSGGFRVAPTVTTDQVTIQGEKETTGNGPAASAQRVYAWKVIDQFGIIHRHAEFTQGVPFTSLSMAGLKTGIYIVSVYDGARWQNQQVVLRR